MTRRWPGWILERRSEIPEPQMRSGGTKIIGKGVSCAQKTPIVTSGRETGPTSRSLPSDMIRRFFSEASEQVIRRMRKGRGTSCPLDGRNRALVCHNWRENGTTMATRAHGSPWLSSHVCIWRENGIAVWVRPNPQPAGFTNGGAIHRCQRRCHPSTSPSGLAAEPTLRSAVAGNAAKA